MAQDNNPAEGGVLAAVLTPVDGDLAPDHPALVAHCRGLLDDGCHGLAVQGTTSEANSFSVPERFAMLDALVEGGIEGWRLVPGTGCCAFPDTLALTRKAVEVGAAAVLMLPPFYYKYGQPVGDDGLFASYSEVIQRIGDERLKILLYHIPQNSGVPLSMALIERLLAAYPGTVIGIKDSNNQLENMTAMVDTFPGFRVFSGSDRFLLELLRAGGASSITACNNVAGPLSARLYAGWGEAGADELQRELETVRATISDYPLVAALKATVARATGHENWRRPRPPLETLSIAEAAELIQRLEAIGFEMKRAA